MAAKTKFRGSFTALVTPFKNGSVDEAAFRGLVNWQIAEGTHGLVPVGTTGESPTLSHDEHKRVVEWCIEEAKGRVPVIAGAGSNSTKEAIELAEHAEKAGANAVLVVTPYYNKPTQEGMYQHFKAINDRHGHFAGDDCLRWAAHRIGRTLRPHDALLARFGGEEFVAALPGEDRAGAAAIAETIRRALNEEPCVSGDLRIPVTASIGVHVMAAAHGERIEVAFAVADRALYVAKANGRDCVEVAA